MEPGGVESVHQRREYQMDDIDREHRHCPGLFDGRDPVEEKFKGQKVAPGAGRGG